MRLTSTRLLSREGAARVAPWKMKKYYPMGNVSVPASVADMTRCQQPLADISSYQSSPGTRAFPSLLHSMYCEGMTVGPSPDILVSLGLGMLRMYERSISVSPNFSGRCEGEGSGKGLKNSGRERQ